MNPARFARDIARARTRYARAAQRFDRAMADWETAAVPIVMVDETVPLWTPRQRDLARVTVGAWSDLMASRRTWDGILSELGCPR
ncbi:hypothetical protein Val02_71160 [Virgisporangium aliadipatigenens]|uniref:Uncharacterized protein n=1 Tax=Virgisporangium aliadipatigenens TaxID=741659 RepID=A0A8J4DTI8_9ACTN|nr:hypothetical protein [Virgisporangium aliadipatigenens]GIJ50230.1 hypothetical protein Val02_71160 [Virgisporangium aliadipatigenens]